MLHAQYDTLRVMTYNTLDFPMSSTGREVHFRTINQYLNVDIIVVNELSNSNGADILLNQALNEYGITYYNKANFVYGSNLNNLLYYNSEKLSLYSQFEIQTNLRDINEYVLYYKSDDLATTNDTIFLYFYVAHLKASLGFEADRLDEVNQFLSRLNAISDAENIFFCGDLNLYTSSEPAYQALINNIPYNLNDPLPAGNWHTNSFYSLIHTQSTRTDDFGGGAIGGLDDRFDFILFSDDVLNGTNKVEFISNTCKAFGNDGNHYNNALIDPPTNPDVPDSVIQALYYMSDHLPVICDIRVEAIVDTTVTDIVITEIMYNPPESGLDSLEFIELYNNGSEIKNIGGYYFSSGIEYTFPSTVLNPGDFVTVAVNSQAMLNTFGVSAFQWTSGGLSNGGELIELKNSSGLTIDIVNYDDVSPWPTEPDGNGPSLILCDPNADNNLGVNWTYSQNFVTYNDDDNPIYATPGFTECGFPPVAAFTADQTEIFTGESISFTDLSSNNPTSWLWTFEGGSPATSTDQNPTITYNSAGIFDVSLSVSNAGGTDEIIAVDYITVTEETTGDLMITEIMQNPGIPIADEDGEWFEVFNPTNSNIDMNGWTIKDNGSDSHTIGSSVIVPANGFTVLGANSNTTNNGNYICDYQYVYNDFQLANGGDEIVLFNPDEEEIDRVEYDGGTNWPGPNGASMIFTGNKNDDNNNHQNWDVAALREPSYFGTTYTDLGSPGTNGTGQNLVIPGFEVDLKVYLEGPFNGINMNTDLTGSPDFPMNQPFNVSPWNYNGSENISFIPVNTVDWVLVEIRDAVSVESATPATILLKVQLLQRYWPNRQHFCWTTE
jgi:PKD repeat protein